MTISKALVLCISEMPLPDPHDFFSFGSQTRPHPTDPALGPISDPKKIYTSFAYSNFTFLLDVDHVTYIFFFKASPCLPNWHNPVKSKAREGVLKLLVSSEPEFVNLYGAQDPLPMQPGGINSLAPQAFTISGSGIDSKESIPESMQPGGPVRQPYFHSVPIAPLDCFEIPHSNYMYHVSPC